MRQLNNGEKKKHSKEVMNKGTFRGVLYMMRVEAHLTLKEKKKRGAGGGGGRFLRPAYETLVLTVKRKGQSRKRKRYLDI